MLSLVMSLLGHQIAERGKEMVETVKLRVIFAMVALALLIPALVFGVYALYLWIALHLGALMAAGILTAAFLFLSILAIIGVIRPPVRRRRERYHDDDPPDSPQTEAVLALEQLSQAIGQLRPGPGNAKSTLGLLGIAALIGYGIGRGRR